MITYFSKNKSISQHHHLKLNIGIKGFASDSTLFWILLCVPVAAQYQTQMIDRVSEEHVFT